MATLKTSLSITSDGTSVKETITAKDTLTITDPIRSLSKIEIDASASADDQLVPNTAGTKYAYISHTGFDASDAATVATLELQNDAGHVLGVLHAGEWCIIPIKASTGVRGEASAGTILAEYAYWTKV